MIKPNELRIGNYIYNHFDNILIVSQIVENKGDYYIHTNFINGLIAGNGHINNKNPIPLAEDWLLKFNFKKFGEYEIYNSNDYDFQIDKSPNDDEYWCFIGRENKEQRPYCVKIKYVHQLQNLYFALTGEELIIKN